MTEDNRAKANQILHQFSDGEIDKETAFKALLEQDVMESEAHVLLSDDVSTEIGVTGPDDPILRD